MDNYTKYRGFGLSYAKDIVVAAMQNNKDITTNDAAKKAILLAREFENYLKNG